MILFGEKDLAKINFAESSCVYLFERKIIKNYQIFRINNELDFNYLKYFIFQQKFGRSYYYDQKKEAIIIKFDIENYDISFKLFNEIIKLFYSNNIKNLYFIFIFNIKEEKNNEIIDLQNKEIKFKKYIGKNIPNEINIKIIPNKNLLYLGINEHNSLKLLNHFLNGKSMNLNNSEKMNLIKEKTNYKPKKIKILSELLLQGEKIENIKNMKDLALTSTKLISNESTYKLYFLLFNMPTGLPDCFLQLIFKEYSHIKDYNNLIVKSIHNWNMINKDKILEESFKEINYIKSCCICLFETLKIYTKLLLFHIDKNRKKIKYRYGNIHYIFNSYRNEKIWKSKIRSSFNYKLEKKFLNQDYNIKNHRENIFNLIEQIINEYNLYSSIEKIKEKLDKYLEEILLLFPSYFFLEKNNKKYIGKSIEFCNKLIKNKRFQILKQKLLLFLYSIDENSDDINEILENERNVEIENDLKIEITFLKEIRRKNKSVKIFENLLSEEKISNEMKFNIYREISIYYYEMKNYEESLKNLENALNIKDVDEIIKQRTIIDICHIIIKKSNENDIINNYKIIKEKINQLNEIIENPQHKNLYYEAHITKDKMYSLFKPDIVMLNANPLKTLNNNVFPFNNQYYILNKLKSINPNIRIKSNILNLDNLKLALNEKGKILIIQSDDFTNEGDIVYESEDGKSIILKKEEFYELVKSKSELSYDLIILCFPKSCKLKEYLYFNCNNFNDNNLISSENIENKNINDNNNIKELNRFYIQFLINFIKYYTENNYKKIPDNFELYKNVFNDKIKSQKINISGENYNYKISSKEELNNYMNIENNFKKINEISFFDNFPNLDINGFDYNIDNINYSSKIYDLIKQLKNENKLIFFCDYNTKKIYLKICSEISKFFYRHKTFYELYYIDIKNDGKSPLKSLIRKINKLKNELDEENESENEEENIEPKKACFILIYNCTIQDLIDVNIYSILDCNSSFIIIYDNKNNSKNGRQMMFDKIISKEDNLFNHYIQNEEISPQTRRNYFVQNALNKPDEAKNINNKDDLSKKDIENTGLYLEEEIFEHKLEAQQNEIFNRELDKYLTNIRDKSETNDSTNKVSEKEKMNIVFDKNGEKINLIVEEDILFSELLKLYIEKLSLPESHIKNLIIFYDGKEITDFNQPIKKIFSATTNPILTVIPRKL